MPARTPARSRSPSVYTLTLTVGPASRAITDAYHRIGTYRADHRSAGPRQHHHHAAPPGSAAPSSPTPGAASKTAAAAARSPPGSRVAPHCDGRCIVGRQDCGCRATSSAITMPVRHPTPRPVSLAAIRASRCGSDPYREADRWRRILPLRISFSVRNGISG